jgi:hypothetical protein
MRACLPHRRAPRARLKFLHTRINARLFSVQARMHARLPLSRPCIGPTPYQKTPQNPRTTPRTYPAQKLETYSYAG